MKGFTLFEMLIAMMLTAVIGTVMFKTWDMVTQSDKQARKVVAARERERIVFGIMNADFTSIIPPDGDGLPPLGKEAIGSSDAFYEAMRRKKEDALPRGAEVLLSFAGGSSLKSEGLGLGFPVCVEYRLERDSATRRKLVRRERDYCGVSGDFPWLETIMLENLQDARMELFMADGSILRQWKSGDLKNEPAGVRFVWKEENGREQEMLFPFFERREEVGWQDETF